MMLLSSGWYRVFAIVAFSMKSSIISIKAVINSFLAVPVNSWFKGFFSAMFIASLDKYVPRNTYPTTRIMA